MSPQTQRVNGLEVHDEVESAFREHEMPFWRVKISPISGGTVVFVNYATVHEADSTELG
jgi:hypothetical protein